MFCIVIRGEFTETQQVQEPRVLLRELSTLIERPMQDCCTAIDEKPFLKNVFFTGRKK
jgi:hypothetical protein